MNPIYVKVHVMYVLYNAHIQCMLLDMFRYHSKIYTLQLGKIAPCIQQIYTVYDNTVNINLQYTQSSFKDYLHFKQLWKAK